MKTVFPRIFPNFCVHPLYENSFLSHLLAFLLSSPL
jgi:hypothetical protein